MLRALGIAAGLPWLIDSWVRLILGRRSRAWRPASEPSDHLRWVVVVPARSEGRVVAPTLASIDEAAHGHAVKTVLLLDGPDDEAVEAARASSAIPIVKMPAGPTKGEALRWLVETRGDLLDDADAVMILDVGSRLTAGFFDRVVWPENVDAIQAWLQGAGKGVGEAASLSENAAQRWQDRGREVLGWTVQLRGTGCAYTPTTFRTMIPCLRTSVEDTEASLLLAADRATIVLAGEGAVVEDVKPTEMKAAAHQRSRWLWGQLSLFVCQPGAVLRLLVRKPAEGVAFITGLVSRPLSLTFLMRSILALAFLYDGLRGGGGSISLIMSSLLALSLASDLVLLRHSTDASFLHLARGGARLLVSWFGAILLLPRAALGWMRSRRS